MGSAALRYCTSNKLELRVFKGFGDSTARKGESSAKSPEQPSGSRKRGLDRTAWSSTSAGDCSLRNWHLASPLKASHFGDVAASFLLSAVFIGIALSVPSVHDSMLEAST